MEFDAVIRRLRSLADPKAVEGMARFGISTAGTLGVSIPSLRAIARDAGRDHELALALWDSGIHEARILAGMVDIPEMVTEIQMENWVRDFDSWDVCDQCCSNLFDKTPFAHKKAIDWSGREEEFVKRAGFALMAALAVHDKKSPDGEFRKYFPVIVREAADERNFVKKAVNWALRQIGKRSPALCAEAVKTAGRIRRIDSKAARWIASDALRELTGDSVKRRFQR
jgi:3-methyladenine DNA glycosylase AlkD